MKEEQFTRRLTGLSGCYENSDLSYRLKWDAEKRQLRIPLNGEFFDGADIDNIDIYAGEHSVLLIGNKCTVSVGLCCTIIAGHGCTITAWPGLKLIHEGNCRIYQINDKVGTLYEKRGCVLL